MSYIFWSDDYLVGEKELDDQHKSLFLLINDLVKLYESEVAHKYFFNKLSQLIKYAEEHFTCEEKYMEKIQYLEIRNHQRKHELLVMRIFDLNKKTVKTNYETLGLVKFLKDWLCVHIKQEDMLYRNFNNRKTPKKSRENKV